MATPKGKRMGIVNQGPAWLHNQSIFQIDVRWLSDCVTNFETQVVRSIYSCQYVKSILVCLRIYVESVTNFGLHFLQMPFSQIK